MHYEDEQVEIHKVVVGPLDNNVFVVRCRLSGDALLVDAANEHEQLLELCRRLGVRKVVETHGHWDHIQAVPQLRDAGYEVAVRAEDAAMLPSYDLLLEDDDLLEVGRLRLRTIHTPGHTPGSMCFLIEGSPHRLVRAAHLRVPGTGDDRDAGPRPGHHDRPRASSPGRMDRAGLVGCISPTDVVLIRRRV
jgi:glyoxylase-like metal-dependent hydrolase (beta-lactamase superfamily II)